MYVSPHRRTIETLCNMLANYPERHELTVVLLPFAKEVMIHYGNIPVDISSLKKECEVYQKKFSFKAFDLS